MPDDEELRPRLERPSPELVALAREFRCSGAAPAPALPSATVVLLRNGPEGPQTFMLRRAATMAFAPGRYVFPGGVAEPGETRGADPPRAAAIRETFEETSVWLAPEALRPWSRWITPVFVPRRYDTWFFVAAAPADASPRHSVDESDASEWIAPARALAAFDRGDWPLMPPTAATLRELVNFRSVAEVLDAAKRRVVRPLEATIDLDADPPVFVWCSR